MSPVLDLATACRPISGYFGDEKRILGSFWGSERPGPVFGLLELDTDPKVATSTFFPLNAPLSSSSLPALHQTCLTGPSLYVLTIAPAFLTFSFDAPAPICVAGSSPVAGLFSVFSAIVPISVGFDSGSSSGAGVALIERSSTSRAPGSPHLSRPCAVKKSAVSPLNGTSDAGAVNAANRSCQLVGASHQCDTARQELAYVQLKLYQVRDGNDELILA